jgi:hypothetical protein
MRTTRRHAGGGEPMLGPSAPEGHAQTSQMTDGNGVKDTVDSVKDSVTGSR